MADSLPIAPGVNVTMIVQDVLAFSVAPQVPPVIEKSAAFGPLIPAVSDTVWGCLLLTVTVFRTFAPNFTLPIEKYAGATVVVDGRPMGKTPLHLDVPATTLGFFRDYVEIRARFIADNKAEVSRTATEEFSPREKVPAVLHFTPTGAQRTAR